jgi:hypothetical protein
MSKPQTKKKRISSTAWPIVKIELVAWSVYWVDYSLWPFQQRHR